MKQLTRRTARILTPLFLATLSAAAAHAQTPEFVPVVVAPYGQPFAANSHGQVAGTRTVLGIARAFVATAGAEELLPLPAGMLASRAFDINEHGVVVGQVTGLTVGEYGRAARWTPTPGGYEVDILDALPGLENSQANAINDLGDVVGFTFISGFGGGPATLFVDSTAPAAGPVDLGALGFQAAPEAINNQRQLVGGTLRMDLDTLAVESLGVPTGGALSYTFGYAYAINEAGQVASTVVAATGGSNPYAVARRTDGVGGGPAEWLVVSPTGAVNTALDIDESGQVLFQMGAGAGNFVALYTDGIGSRFLADLLPSGWVPDATWAGALTPLGQIAVPSAVPGGAGILLATPEPGIVANGGCGDAPADSFTWTGGTAQPGATLEVAVHNPLGTQAPGSLSFVAFSPNPASPAPCGVALPGLGMAIGSSGALLVDVATPAFATIVGAAWNGAPVGISLPIPPVAALGGSQFFLQGALVDLSPGAALPFALAGGLEVTIGL